MWRGGIYLIMDKMSRVDYEEAIASLIFDFEYRDADDRPSEATCAELGRLIVQTIGLANFLQLGVDDG